MTKKFKQSFYEWCIENNRQDLLDRWDYELNDKNPKDISSYTHKKYYLMCPNGMHESELCSIEKINSRNSKVKCKKCNSFAQWGIDNICNDFLEKYWDYDKNTVDPWEITYGSDNKVWIKCQEKKYHNSYSVKVNMFSSKNTRCPYCASIKVHPKDSFAQYHIDNTDKDFLEKYWSNKNTLNPFEISKSSDIKVWIKCINTNYHNDYLVATYNFTKLNRRCPCCTMKKVHKYDSLGIAYPELFRIWSNKNEKTPYEFSIHSGKTIWLKCLNGHEDYQMVVYIGVKFGFKCTQCTKERTESMLQEKVRLYISDILNYKLNHEYKCSIVPINPKTKSQLPFDNEIIDLKLLVETMGYQHYLPVGWNKTSAKHNNTTPEYELHYQKLKDRYKRFIAHYRNYSYLEIPYWTEQDESYKKLIDDKIAEILAKQESEVA